MNIFGKRSELPFSRKSDRKKEKSTVSFTHVQNIICSQTQLDGIAHEQTIICRQLFAGHVVGSRPMKRKKKLLRMKRCTMGDVEVAYSCTSEDYEALEKLDSAIASCASFVRSNLLRAYCNSIVHSDQFASLSI